MKLTLKLFLVICLFSSIALADGDQPTGGKSCPAQQTCVDGDQPTGGFGEGDQGTGGRAVNAQDESVLTFIQKYLISIFE